MSDILFKTENYVFSYRVAGILIRDGKVLLQKPTNETGYAFPGGHVEFGETNEETLIREFKEEIGADIKVKEIKWVAEIFFPWGDKPCHQICLYYIIELKEYILMNITYKQFTPEYNDAVLELQHTWVYENITYGVVNETIEDMLGYAKGTRTFFGTLSCR